jgi:hypothetical protein
MALVEFQAISISCEKTVEFRKQTEEKEYKCLKGYAQMLKVED